MPAHTFLLQIPQRLRLKPLLWIFITLALLPSHTTYATRPHHSGASYYIAPSGNDSNLGTFSAPWQTIQHALNPVSGVTAGDIIYVRSGTYHEEIAVNVSGSAAGGYITLQAYPGETPIIDGNNNLAVGFRLNGVSYITIDGFEIRNFESDADWELAAGIEVREGAHHIQLLNNKIHSIQPQPPTPNAAIANGIGIYGTDNSSVNNILIDGNELYNLTLGWSEALTLNGNVELFTVTNNIIHDNNNIGIDVIGGEEWIEDDEGVSAHLNQARDGIIADNLVYNIDSFFNPVYGDAPEEYRRSAPCLYVDGGTRVTIERNIVHDCNFGVSIGSEHAGLTSSYVTLRHNLIYHNHTGGLVMGGSDINDNGGSTFNEVLNNTFFKNDTDNNGGGEIWFQHETRNNTIKNNIFYASEQDIVFSNFYSTLSNNVIDYNLYYTVSGANATTWVWNSTDYTSFSAWKLATGFDANSIFAMPKFVFVPPNLVTAPDLHLQNDSPAINAGSSLATAALDIDGDMRLADCTPDIGADEVLFALPIAVTDTAVNGTVLTLKWDALVGSVKYRLYSDTMPYFTAGGVADWEGSEIETEVTGHLGSPAANHYYVVQSVNCEQTQTAVSPRFGAFTFAITPGSP